MVLLLKSDSIGISLIHNCSAQFRYRFFLIVAAIVAAAHVVFIILIFILKVSITALEQQIIYLSLCVCQNDEYKSHNFTVLLLLFAVGVIYV